MNIPEIYLVEPYNAYAPKGRKKHWHEVVEEQALMQRIMAEQMALQEAASKTLPPNSPPTSIQTAVGTPPAGAGGQPVWDFWNPTGDIVNFSATPLAGAGPMTVVFTNLTTTPQFDTYLWLFGDGTTSTEINPTHVYHSASALITASLQVSSSTTGQPGGNVTKNGYISASVPLVIASGSYITSSGPGPISASFTNLTVNTSQTPTTLYKLFYGDGQSASFAISGTIPSTPVIHNYVNTGSFTASIQATGSYRIASAYTAAFFVPAPTLNAAFTFNTSSNYAPATTTFLNGTSYNGVGGNLTYHWELGSGSLTSSAIIPLGAVLYGNAGPYTASLAVTESLYGIKSFITRSWRLEVPTLTAAFTTQSAGYGAEANNPNEPVSMSFTSSTAYAGNGTLTYLWNFGSASIGGQSGTSTAVGPHYRFPYILQDGGYTASLQVTASNYGLTSKATKMFYVSS